MLSPLRILIVLPRQPLATGNHVTANRFADGLRQRGHVVELLEVASNDAPLLQRRIASFAPDLVHLLHAWRSGVPWLTAGCTQPYVVSLTGTDSNQDLHDPTRRDLCRTVLDGAAAVVTQNPLTHDELLTLPEAWTERLHYLPPGVILGTAAAPPLWPPGEAVGLLRFLHPAGIRPVKANLELLLLCDPLADRYPQFRLLFCGPELDPDYAARFHTALASRSWAHYLGILPPATIPAVLRQMDVVLNHSHSEGLANVLLEATCVGCPILARAIPGNRAAVQEGVNGLLYHDSASFCSQAARLLDGPELRRQLGRPRPERYSATLETARLEALYRQILLPRAVATLRP